MYSVKFYSIAIFLFIILSHAGIKAQEDVGEQLFRISFLTSDEGLSQNTVDCILKDSRGFMWFGTWNGLNRYDGYSFKVYKKEDTPHSLSSNFIYTVCEDTQGNLWIGTRNGLNLLDFKKDRFINFLHDSLNQGSIAGNWINILICDPEGAIWIGTNGSGLDKIILGKDNDNYSIEHFNVSEHSSLRIPGNLVNSLFFDSKKRLWIGTASGLSLYDKKRDTSYVFLSHAEDINSLTSNDIRCTFEDSEGVIWIGTQFGLNRWLEGTNQFIRYYNTPNDPSSLSHSSINAIGEDPMGRLYIATLGGLDIYNRSFDSFYHLPVNEQENFSLNNEFINSLWCDTTGLVWVGTEKGGINKFNIYQKQFKYYSADSKDKFRLNHNTVNSILEEGELLWVGTAGGGLNLINRNTGKVKYFTYNSQRTNSLGNDFVTSLCRDKNNKLWVGTWGGGFSELLSVKGTVSFKYYRNDPDNSESLINNFVSAIVEDCKGNIWIGTEGGLDLFHPDKNTFIHIQNQANAGEQISEVGCLLQDKNENLWIGTRQGLFFISEEYLDNIDQKVYAIKASCFRNNPDIPHSLNENYVISLCEDMAGNIWIGTYGKGLNKLIWDGSDPGSVKFEHYTQEEGLSNNVVYGILEDKYHNLWLSTDYGLSQFNPTDKKFSNYYVSDGLQSNQFYWSAYAAGEDGTLYFGGMKGVNYFQPEKIISNTIPPRPVLTDFKVLNNLVEPGIPFGKRIILDKLISETNEIELSYKENTFSIEFSGLSFHLPEKNMYEYKLEGVDENWVRVGSNRRFANYTKLPGGEYIFRLRAANNDGLWNVTPTELKIKITPPFWKTNWFRVFLGVLLILLIIIYLRLHTRALKSQKRKLEQLVNERTAQIEAQKIKLERQNTEILDQRDRLIQLNKKVKAANQQKLKFFTNISHEFRTPITLILGPLEKLRKNWKGMDETKELLNLITRNAERLLYLINQLMDFRKIEKGKMALHVQKGSLDEFIKAILEAFRDLELQKNIELHYYCSSECETALWFDHEKLENVLFNLLSNAFKYTPDKGNITVQAKLVHQIKEESISIHNGNTGTKSIVEIEVADTGIGISKENQPNIFKRFYQGEYMNEGSMGSGIGLSLTRDLVKVHRGNIFVESTLGKGTKFTLRLPCTRDAFSEEEITESNFGGTNLKSHVDVLGHILEAERAKGDDAKFIEFQKYDGQPTILIVEDNREMREFIASSLNQKYNILVAENGEIAFDLALKHNPELIISDIMMPVMDGLHLCSMIKQKIETSHIPLILLTAKDAVENQIEGFKSGADEYIPKPFNLELLEARIHNLLESRKILRELFSKSTVVSPKELTANPTDQKFLSEALKHIEKNIDNTEFNVNDFASVMCVSRSLLHKKLTALTDQSATDFINTVRLKKSKEIMMEGSYNISGVAYAVGYNDPKYFSRLFKKHFGISPSEYIKQLRTEAG